MTYCIEVLQNELRPNRGFRLLMDLCRSIQFDESSHDDSAPTILVHGSYYDELSRVSREIRRGNAPGHMIPLSQFPSIGNA